MSISEMAKDFKKKYPDTICWRVRKHAEVIESYINPDEKVLFVFCGQKNPNLFDWFSSCVIALTNKRILIGQKRVLWGSFYTQITPDLYNDMQVYQGLLWGKVTIDTVKEEIVISSISKKGLDEIETRITEFMMQEKKKYQNPEQ